MGTLRDEWWQSYEQDGFVIVPGLFRAGEMRVLKQEMQRVLDAVRRAEREAGRDGDAIAASGVFVGLAANSPVFQEAAADPRILDVLEAVLAPDLSFLSDKAVFKSDATDFGTPWHQDWAYWRGSHKASVWIPADDATPENGCLKVLPGSHQAFATHDGDTSDGRGFGNRIRRESIDESRAVVAAIEAGGAVFFHDLLLHASYPNTSGTDRWVWIPTYRDARAEEPHYPWAVAAQVVRGGGTPV